MGEVVRRPSVIRDLAGFEARLTGARLLTGARRRGPVTPWRTFGAPGEPGLVNGWTGRAGSTDAPAGFMLDERGVAWIRGHIGAGAPSSMVCAYLPEGYRPPQTIRRSVAGRYFDTFAGVTSWAFYCLLIHAAGTLEVHREVSQVYTDQDIWLDAVQFATL